MTIEGRRSQNGWVIPIMAAASLFAAGCRRSSAATLEAPELFAATCARCHGLDGAGGVPSTDGGPAPRNFRDHGFQASQTDEQLRATIKNGKGSMMPPFATVYSDEQIAEIATHVRSFDPARGTR
jgi:mono/diheme cytochrome c family protein